MDASIAIRNRRRTSALVLSGLIALGCGRETTGPGPIPPDQLYWALHLNWNAVNMALDTPYNTLQLTATPVVATGAALAGAGPVVYTSADSTVTVDATGRITAHYVTTQTWVAASLTVDGTTLTDTAFVRVTPHDTLSGPVTALSIQTKPGGLDSAGIAMDKVTQMNNHPGYPPSVRGTIPVYVTTGTGAAAADTVCNARSCPLLIAFTASDPRVAKINKQTGRVTSVLPGHVTFTASTWVYGVGLQDSLAFTMRYRLGSNIIGVYAGGTPSSPAPVLAIPTMVIGLKGNVLISNQTGQLLEVTYPNTPMVHRQGGTGQVVDTVAIGSLKFPAVQFDSVGTYTYHLKMLGSGNTRDGVVFVTTGPE